MAAKRNRKALPQVLYATWHTDDWLTASKNLYNLAEENIVMRAGVYHLHGFVDIDSTVRISKETKKEDK